MLEKYGIIDALVVRKVDKHYEIINGHLRHELLKQPIPCLVVNANDQQAAKMLATYDPVSSQATINQNALKKLIAAQGEIELASKPTFDHLMGQMTSLEEYSRDIDLEKQFGLTIEHKPTKSRPADDSEEEEEKPSLKQPDLPPADTNLINLYYEDSDHEQFVKILKAYREANGGVMIPIPTIVISIMKEIAA